MNCIRWKDSPRVLASACASVVLPTPGNVFDQQMAARQEAGEAETELTVLAQDDPVELGEDGVDIG